MKASYPITDITNQPYPELGWVRDPTTNLPRPLHIADRRGKQNGSYRYLARCGRAIGFDHRFHDGISKRAPVLEGFELCKRCGSRSDFEAALEAHNAGYAKRLAEYGACQAEAEARRERGRMERVARADRLKQLLNVSLVEDKQYLIAFEHEGYRYSITEEGVV